MNVRCVYLFIGYNSVEGKGLRGREKEKSDKNGREKAGEGQREREREISGGMVQKDKGTLKRISGPPGVSCSGNNSTCFRG